MLVEGPRGEGQVVIRGGGLVVQGVGRGDPHDTRVEVPLMSMAIPGLPPAPRGRFAIWGDLFPFANFVLGNNLEELRNDMREFAGRAREVESRVLEVRTFVEGLGAYGNRVEEVVGGIIGVKPT